MKAIVALEELIKQDETHIKLAKKQLADHEAGTNRLSHMVKATAETSLEEASIRLEKNKAKLQELLKLDIKELEKEERLREAVLRKNYFHYQKTRIKRSINRTNDQKLEAMLIIDELPEGIGFEDDILFAIAEQSIKLQLSLHEGLHQMLKEIREDFQDLLSNLKEEDIQSLEILNDQIAVVVLHFSVLVSNINENLQEDEKPEFPGFPKFEDWWIAELWTNHQAYFGLYKWKEIVSRLCITTDQKQVWETISANWISIKRYIHSKGRLGFEYNYAFDTLIRSYCGLEEELATTSLESMEKIITTLTAKEDFSKFVNKERHQIITPYTKFKRSKLQYKDIKGKVNS